MLFKTPLVTTGRACYEHYCQDHHGHEQDSDSGQGQLGHLARPSTLLHNLGLELGNTRVIAACRHVGWSQTRYYYDNLFVKSFDELDNDYLFDYTFTIHGHIVQSLQGSVSIQPPQAELHILPHEDQQLVGAPHHGLRQLSHLGFALTIMKILDTQQSQHNKKKVEIVL